jgi:hypothetical protein
LLDPFFIFGKILEAASYIQNPEILQFIEEHKHISPFDLSLKKFPNTIPKDFVIQQINGIQRSSTKFPALLKYPCFIYPKQLNLEQSSSELSAQFKAGLMQGNVVDITGGLGIDCIYFAKNGLNVTHIEQNTALQETAQHNFTALKLNIQSLAGNGIELLKKQENVDWIYLDPARRDMHKNKVYSLEDSEPNILQHLDFLHSKANNILLKAAPMIDIKGAIHQLKNVFEVYVVSIDNECKEVLFHLNKTATQAQIHCIDLLEKDKTMKFTYAVEESLEVEFTEPQTYIYEPNASILKAGAFKSICAKFKVKKLHPNTHLYTSKSLLTHFPGRAFCLEQVIKADFNALKFALPSLKANLSIRNFPMKVQDLKQKLKLKDGGEYYIFACTLSQNQKALLLCKKADS